MTKRLLTGGNPQIAKGEGDAPVQAYIAALDGWKQTVCRSVDRLVEEAVPGARKAVKWNSPFYGVPGEQDWFLSIHVFTRYVKLTFFNGAALDPLPPRESKTPSVRAIDIYETDTIDAAQLGDWFRQAAAAPGWRP